MLCLTNTDNVQCLGGYCFISVPSVSLVNLMRTEKCLSTEKYLRANGITLVFSLQCNSIMLGKGQKFDCRPECLVYITFDLNCEL